MNNYFLTFKEWYNNIGGKAIQIDYKERMLLVTTEDGEAIISVAYFGRSVPIHFTIDDLLDRSKKIEGSLTYFVVVNGIGGKNWLYTRKVGKPILLH